MYLPKCQYIEYIPKICVKKKLLGNIFLIADLESSQNYDLET